MVARPSSHPVHDLVVIGGGSAGLIGARVAAALGARVALVEREAEPGGDCLWSGCVPSKAFIAAARRAHDVRAADDMGVRARLEQVSFAGVMEHVRAAQRSIAPHDSRAHLHRLGVETRVGAARLHPGNRVVVGSAEASELRGRHVLIATGSTPVVPDIPGIELVETVTTDSFWDLQELPRRLLVIGGGPVGCELAQACARLGSRVTVVEPAGSLLDGEEPAASAAAMRALKADGAQVLVGRRVCSFEGGHAVLDDRARIPFDTCLLAIGRRANLELLRDPELLAVERTGSGHLAVDRVQRTSRRRVWAAGDVTGQLPLTNAAGLQGANAALNALLRMRRRFDPLVVPRVTFTDPEIGRVGLTARRARERYDDIEELVVPLSQVDRAVVAGSPHGELRLVTRSGTRLVGATWIGETAGEQLTHLAPVLGRRGSVRALAALQHGYPTFGEASRNAAFEHQLQRAGTPAAARVLRRSIAVLSRLS